MRRREFITLPLFWSSTADEHVEVLSASHFASERLTADMRRDGGAATAASESWLTAHSSNAIQSRKKAPGCCKVRWSSSPDSRSRRSTTHSRSQLRSTTVRNRNRPDSHSRR